MIRVSTNHIERLRVEVRRTLAHMTVDKTKQSLNLESYRQLRLFDKNHNPNLVRLLRDVQAMWPIREAKRREREAELKRRLQGELHKSSKTN